MEDKYLVEAKKIFDLEIKTLEKVLKSLDDNFSKTVAHISKNKGHVVVTGVGKSGMIGRKIAATLSSTGTPSFFIHSGEAYHGDLGMIKKEDVILAISKSGETEEVLKLIPFIKHNQNSLVAITSKKESTLAQNADFLLEIQVEKEACPLELAPTCSTTATLVMGDALAMVLMKEKNFNEEDFARFHPGGSLGKKLLTKVCNRMRTKNLPVIGLESSILQTIEKINEGNLGLAIVLDGAQNLYAIVTDGDIRRALALRPSNQLELKDVMSFDPKTILPSSNLIEAEKILNQHQITTLLVVENRKLLGSIQIYDIIN